MILNTSECILCINENNKKPIAINGYIVHYGQDFLDKTNYDNIQKKIDFFEERFNILEENFKTIKDIITEIYYSPGMPGYLKAKENFGNTVLCTTTNTKH